MSRDTTPSQWKNWLNDYRPRQLRAFVQSVTPERFEAMELFIRTNFEHKEAGNAPLNGIDSLWDFFDKKRESKKKNTIWDLIDSWTADSPAVVQITTLVFSSFTVHIVSDDDKFSLGIAVRMMHVKQTLLVHADFDLDGKGGDSDNLSASDISDLYKTWQAEAPANPTNTLPPNLQESFNDLGNLVNDLHIDPQTDANLNKENPNYRANQYESASDALPAAAQYGLLSLVHAPEDEQLEDLASSTDSLRVQVGDFSDLNPPDERTYQIVDDMLRATESEDEISFGSLEERLNRLRSLPTAARNNIYDRVELERDQAEGRGPERDKPNEDPNHGGGEGGRPPLRANNVVALAARPTAAAPRPRPIGVSLNIGLNTLDPDHYGGLLNALQGAEKDARLMQLTTTLAPTNLKEAGLSFIPVSLVNEKATRANVIAQFRNWAAELNAGDLLVVSFAGYGAQVPASRQEEADQQHETWCLFDGQLLDTELYQLLTAFRKGVRVVIFSDSCHSGGMLNNHHFASSNLRGDLIKTLTDSNLGNRSLPLADARTTFLSNHLHYSNLSKKTPGLAATKAAIQASVLFFAACQEGQDAFESNGSGIFTSVLLSVWDNGKFRGTYRDFFQEIQRLMPAVQSPRLLTEGVADPLFDTEQVFSISEERVEFGPRPFPVHLPAKPQVFRLDAARDLISALARTEQTQFPSAQLVQVPQNTLLLNSVGTIEGWVVPTWKTRTDDACIFSFGSDLSLFISAARDKIRVKVADQFFEAKFQWTQGVAHHLTFFVGTGKLLIDSSVTLDPQVDPKLLRGLATNLYPMTVGAYLSGQPASQNFEGQIVSLRFWGSVLSPAAVSASAVSAAQGADVQDFVETASLPELALENLFFFLQAGQLLAPLPSKVGPWVPARFFNILQPLPLQVPGVDTNHHGRFEEVPFCAIVPDPNGNRVLFVNKAVEFSLLPVAGSKTDFQVVDPTDAAQKVLATLSFKADQTGFNLSADLPNAVLLKDDYLLAERDLMPQRDQVWADNFTNMPNEVNLSTFGWHLLKMDVPPGIENTGARSRVIGLPGDKETYFSQVGSQAFPFGQVHVLKAFSETDFYTTLSDSASEYANTLSGGDSSSLSVDESVGIPELFSVEGGFTLSNNSSFKNTTTEKRFDEFSYTHIQTFATTYGLWFDRRNAVLSADFLAAVEGLKTSFSDQAVSDFFDEFGTHFANSVVYGGRGIQETKMSKTAITSIVESGTDLENGLKTNLKASGTIPADVPINVGGGVSTEDSIKRGKDALSSLEATSGVTIQTLQCYGNLDCVGDAIHVGNAPLIPVFADLRPITELLAPPFFTDYAVIHDLRNQLQTKLDDLLKPGETVVEEKIVYLRFKVLSTKAGTVNKFPLADLIKLFCQEYQLAVTVQSGQSAPVSSALLDLTQMFGVGVMGRFVIPDGDVSFTLPTPPLAGATGDSITFQHPFTFKLTDVLQEVIVKEFVVFFDAPGDFFAYTLQIDVASPLDFLSGSDVSVGG